MPHSIRLRSPGPSFAAQPDALTVEVSFIIGPVLNELPVFVHFLAHVEAPEKKNETEIALWLNFGGTYYKPFYQVLTKGTKIFVFFVPFPFL